MPKLMQCSKTREELLLNTVRHFNSENRAQNLNGCVYRTKDGKGCAIGREISNALAHKFDKRKGENVYVTSDYVFNFLPKRLQKMGKKFLAHIQDLHDLSSYWDKEGLSTIGLNRAMEIVRKFDLNITESQLSPKK